MRITDTLVIDEAEIEERYMRASGAGGQHVNKTESAIQLRFNALENRALTADQKTRLKKLAGSRMTLGGEILIRAENSRSRERNRAEARERLRRLIERCLTAPKPRKKSRPSLASVRRQKDAKMHRSGLKASRRKPTSDD